MSKDYKYKTTIIWKEIIHSHINEGIHWSTFNPEVRHVDGVFWIAGSDGFVVAPESEVCSINIEYLS